jgi:hypothetical protein
MLATSDIYPPERSTLEQRPPPRLYRQFFTAAECRMLDSSPPESALSDIALLRILLARVLSAAKARARLSLEDHFSMLTAFCRTARTMASLARLNAKYFGYNSPGYSLLDALDDLDPDDLRAC